MFPEHVQYGWTSDRRGFLTALIAGLGALSAALVGVPIVGTLLAPATRRGREESWVEFGPVESIPIGVPQLVTAVSHERDGWHEQSVRRAVWVVRAAADGVTVFSPRCTHLGCAYRWDAQNQQFACPCHGGTYAITGQVTGGPPPERLAQLAARVDHGTLYVQVADGGTTT